MRFEIITSEHSNPKLGLDQLVKNVNHFSLVVNPVPDWFPSPSALTSTTAPPDELTPGALNHDYWGDIGTSAFLLKNDITNW